MATITGTPLYLSPKLAAGVSTGSQEVEHNVYKSDVYSLGITFIHLTMLELPIFMLGTQSSSEAIDAHLLNSKYSNSWKKTLMWLTVHSEEDRCDFIQLKTYLDSLFAPTSAPSVPSEQLSDLMEKRKWMRCLWCKNKRNRAELKDAIQLFCDPQDHVFCSQICFTQFTNANANKPNFLCPACETPIPNKFIFFTPDTRCTLY